MVWNAGITFSPAQPPTRSTTAASSSSRVRSSCSSASPTASTIASLSFAEIAVSAENGERAGSALSAAAQQPSSEAGRRCTVPRTPKVLDDRVILDEGASDVCGRGVPHAQCERDLGGGHHLGVDAADNAGDARQLIGRHRLDQSMAVDPPSDDTGPGELHDPIIALAAVTPRSSSAAV